MLTDLERLVFLDEKACVMKHRDRVHLCGKTNVGIVTALLGLLCAPGRAFAFDEDVKAHVQRNYEAARADYVAQHYCEAADEFTRCLDDIPLPVLALWAARSAAKCGDLVAAVATYARCTQLSPNDLWSEVKQQRAQVAAASELAALQRRIPQVIVKVTQSDDVEASVTLDGTALAKESFGTKVPINPGTHVVVYTHGEQSVTRHIRINERQLLVVRFPLNAPVEAAPAPAPALVAPMPPHRDELDSSEPAAPHTEPGQRYKVASVMSFVIGGAGLAAGIVTRILALGQRTTIDSHCDPYKVCDSTGMDAISKADSLQTQSSVYLILGTAGVATGIGLIIAGQEESSPQTQLRAMALPGAAGLNLERSF